MAEWSKATDLSSVTLWSAQVRTLLDAPIAAVAQSAEHQTFNLRVVGSSPIRGYSPRQDF